MSGEGYQLEGATKQSSLLPARLVHELRTPLTAIHGYAQVLARSPSNEELVQRASAIMLRESNRLGAMLSELSELAELEAGPLVLAPTTADVCSVAQESVRLATSRTGEVTVRMGPADASEVRCDPRRVSQIMVHLLNNATSFTPAGGRVSVSVESSADGSIISVSDTGVGVPSDESESIYRLYTRGSAASTRGVRGLGLGLYLAANIALQCGGCLWHEPRPDGGTTFHLWLPERASDRSNLEVDQPLLEEKLEVDAVVAP